MVSAWEATTIPAVAKDPPRIGVHRADEAQLDPVVDQTHEHPGIQRRDFDGELAPTPTALLLRRGQQFPVLGRSGGALSRFL
jgi:hypothetical protein